MSPLEDDRLEACPSAEPSVRARALRSPENVPIPLATVEETVPSGIRVIGALARENELLAF